MYENQIQKKVVHNLFWRFAERSGAQIVSFVVSLILARLLLPEDYGTVALITVFTNILQVFVDSGMANALIQKKDADDLDFSTAFWFNIFLCSIIYFLLFIVSPLIAKFYDNIELTKITRVLGITILISGLKNVQQAYVSRKLIFKKFFFATLLGTLSSAILGIYLAYKGYGVWALIVQQLTNTIVDTMMLWILVPWRPHFLFSFSRFKILFSFGWKLLVSGLIDTIYNNLRQLIIGKMYSTADLAYYNKGKQFPEIIITNIDTSINSILFPVMSNVQDEKSNVKHIMRRSIKVSSFVIWPFLVGLIVIADPLVRIILTDKWLPIIPYLRIFCLTFALWPIHTVNLNAINALGRSDIFLILEIIKKGIGIAVLILTMWHGPLIMAWSMLFIGVISVFINSFPNNKLLNYSLLEQLKDILPNMILSAVMGVFVYLLVYVPICDLLKVLIQIAAGIMIYILLAKFTKNDNYFYIKNYLQSNKHIK